MANKTKQNSPNISIWHCFNMCVMCLSSTSRAPVASGLGSSVITCDFCQIIRLNSFSKLKSLITLGVKSGEETSACYPYPTRFNFVKTRNFRNQVKKFFQKLLSKKN